MSDDETPEERARETAPEEPGDEAPTTEPSPGVAPPIPRAKGPLPMKAPLALACMALTAVFYWLAFPTYDAWPLSLVTFVPFYLALVGQTPRRALGLGLFCGVLMTCLGFYWLFNMLRTFSGFPAPICAFFVLVVNLYQGGRFALQAWLTARAWARGWHPWAAFIVAFAASELVFPLLFPWYYAATVHAAPVLMQTADLGGPILVGCLLLLPNLAIGEVLRARLERRAWDRRLVGVGAGALGFLALYGIARIGMTTASMDASPEIRVGYVQGNMGLFQKREDPGEGLRRHKRLTADLKNKGVDLVVWSESSVTVAVPERMYAPFMKDRVSAYLGVPTIFGGVVFRNDPDRERWFNTALASNAEGDITGRYDKQFLLAFGEYLPFGEAFPKLYKYSPNSGRFSPGTSDDAISVFIRGKEHKVTVLICYEDVLPGFTNRLVRKGDPELLVNITNDSWFGDTTEPWEHLALAKFRAIEHRRFLVRATNSGVSAIVDANGRTVTHSGTFKAETGDAPVRLMRGKTVYEILGDVPWWLVSIGAFLIAFRRRETQAPPRPRKI